MKENHLVFIEIQIIRQINKVWIKIIIKIITGFEDKRSIILKKVESVIKDIISKISLFKILTLEVKDNS